MKQAPMIIIFVCMIRPELCWTHLIPDTLYIHMNKLTDIKKQLSDILLLYTITAEGSHRSSSHPSSSMSTIPTRMTMPWKTWPHRTQWSTSPSCPNNLTTTSALKLLKTTLPLASTCPCTSPAIPVSLSHSRSHPISIACLT